jgi:hypothetical protein
MIAARRSTDPAVLLRFLTRLQRRQLLMTIAGLLGGAVLALLGPMLILLFYLLFSTTLMASYGFWGTYWIIAAVTLPIFFLMAFTLRGSVLERWVPDGDSLSGRFARRYIAPTLVILEIANAGPRLIIWAVERVLGHARVSGASPQRMASCLAILMQADGGISPLKLLLPGESPDCLEPLLAYLLYHGIIDLSKQGDRVWLVSHVRRELGKQSV